MTPGGAEVSPSSNWTVGLSCGHRIGVLPDEVSLVVMAHLVRHEATSGLLATFPRPKSGRRYFVPILPGVAPR